MCGTLNILFRSVEFDLAKICRQPSANITSPLSRTGRTPPPLPAPSPGWKKIYALRSANEKRWRATALQDAGARFVNFDNAKRLGLRQPSGAFTSARWAGWKKICAPASANKPERGSMSRSTSDLQTLPFIPNTFCLAKLLRVTDPRSVL